MDRVFVGSEALARGELTGYELRTFYQRLHPDVYALKRMTLSRHDRAMAAWLWSRRQGVVSGLGAAALHGAKWVDDDVPVELIWPNHRAPAGVITRDETLLPRETQWISGLPVTTPARTAFDLARCNTVGAAVARLDALSRAVEVEPDDVLEVGRRHPHVRGLGRLAEVLDLIDAGAQSPRESWLRLELIGAGFPRPQTQIPVLSPGGYPRYYLDMGWPDVMVAVEYDGDQHRVDQRQFRKDITRMEYVNSVGWIVVRVVAGDRAEDVVRRVHRLWAR